MLKKKYRQCRRFNIDIGSISYDVMSILYQYCIHSNVDNIEKEIYVLDMNVVFEQSGHPDVQ